MFGVVKTPLRAETDRILAGFVAAGAVVIETEALQPAETLLDLYGEDIRARAYVTADPVRGELMLRPDFTVPIVQKHMQHGADSARYTYSGKVWRKQDQDENRKSEYHQVGFEVFGGADPAKADAEVFALLADVLKGLPVTPVVGDISLIFAAIDVLDTNDRRKAALRRHVWRPARFLRLLKRYSSHQQVSALRQAVLDAAESGNVPKLVEISGKMVSLRSIDEISERAGVLLNETKSQLITVQDVEMVARILDLKCTMNEVADKVREIAPALNPAAKRLEARAQALADQGIDTSVLLFEASYGRTTLEYYDGFVFGFHAQSPDYPQVAQGGRYDALTRVLGNGQSVPAVGGIVRPETVLALKGQAV